MLCNDAAPVHPPLGTLIDDDSLELVEVLGVGGYGVVYRAEEICCSSPKSYAVKCLLHRSSAQFARQRQIHIREIALHQLASAHPNVVTLHRVIEDYNCTYIIMDYAPDHDLFHQILHNCRYLGNDYLVKHVFLQLLDAVEYCHSLGIYHRDLKPENVLCWDDGLRVAITDFGLATTDKFSEEFRTGSVYHMSPECQGGEFAPTGSYSPMFNDIWSLGIILLNLATGRNPWKSASVSDPTFQAYLRDPQNFLPTVLPISPEINAILSRMLEVDWRDRMTIPELRLALEDVDTFYADSVIFEGSMAKCGWESGIEIDNDSTKHSAIQSQEAELKSHWSQESFSSDIVFASHSAIDSPWVGYSPFQDDTYAMRADVQSDYQRYSMGPERHDLFVRPKTPPSMQSPCVSAESGASYPVTPNSFDLTFGGRAVLPQRKPLIIDTSCVRPPYCRGDSLDSGSVESSIMQTAVEYPSDLYAAETFFGSSMSNPIAVAQSVRLGDSGQTEDKPMASPTAWAYSTTQVSGGTSTFSSTKRSFTTTNMSFDNRSSAPSPEPLEWSELSSRLKETCPPESQPSPPLYMTNAADVSLPPIRSISPTRKNLETKFKATFFTPLKFFPRHSSGQNSSETMVPSTSLGQEMETCPAAIFTPMEFLSPSVPEACSNHWSVVVPSKPLKINTVPISQTKGSSFRKSNNHRSPALRHWFLSSKLFPSSIVS
ncbi:kinase-like domain-containing protein [Lentinula detonsa]|uniref:Kinase-like domain-containing protein n=1 Tax=Lentinula detonsa TaxID=2804962 RepID=A0A9W8NX34_9AGAR|nr:kinase-like domain-containing protein [Lentinula detonsa]